jgi:hypothetical protein
MGTADGACLRRGASLMDADANMNCTKQRQEEATSQSIVPGTLTATSILSVTAKGSLGTEMQVSDAPNYVPKWRWPDLTVQLFIHLGCLYGFYLIFTSVKMLTALWGKSTNSFSIRKSIHILGLFWVAGKRYAATNSVTCIIHEIL